MDADRHKLQRRTRLRSGTKQGLLLPLQMRVPISRLRRLPQLYQRARPLATRHHLVASATPGLEVTP